MTGPWFSSHLRYQVSAGYAAVAGFRVILGSSYSMLGGERCVDPALLNF